MIIGIPKEIKLHEYRVSLIPEAVKKIIDSGFKVLVERNAGIGSGIEDSEYIESGATIVKTSKALYEKSDLIVKVKEPQPKEYKLLKRNHTLFCYLHLAANKGLTKALLKKGTRAIAFETVQLNNGYLPLLAPMSRLAGKLSIQIGMQYLQKNNNGKGLLISGAPGVKPAKVLIIGGGTVGYNAAVSAVGVGADVTVIDIDTSKLKFFYENFKNRVKTLPSYPDIIERECSTSDIVVGAVLVTGARAPKIVTSEVVKKMEAGTVMVDVAIDQGGCFETSKPTNHDSPVFKKFGVIHYCVTNIPSVVSKTASHYLSNEITPYVIEIANNRIEHNEAICKGINTDNGKLIIEFD